MNLSPLRSHKKHHNFADTPSDICSCNQGVEYTRYFLFECLSFATHRASLAVTVTDGLHRNNLSVDNKRILSATPKTPKDSALNKLLLTSHWLALLPWSTHSIYIISSTFITISYNYI